MTSYVPRMLRSTPPLQRAALLIEGLAAWMGPAKRHYTPHRVRDTKLSQMSVR
jgi:hypothetical protein